MINVGRVLHSRNFSQSFDVYRKTGGAWDAGRFEQDETKISMIGVVTVAKPKELEQLPEGDRVLGIMSFHCTKPIFVTHSADTPGTSDEIVWNGEKYRVSAVLPNSDYGYWKAYGVRVVGD